VRITGTTINRVSDGKIVESWTNYDALGMMQQIGAVPEPEGGQG
jgi:predicted ester cyclase